MSAASQLPYRLGRTLGTGIYATTHEVDTPRGPAVLKLANAEPLPGDGTKATYLTEGIGFVTGGLGGWEPEPNAILDAEARVLTGVRHPAMVKLLDTGTAPQAGRNCRYLLLERIAGRTWRAALNSAEPPTLAHVRALVDALAAMQASGELPYHGDLKPENLMLDAQGRVRLLDPSAGMNTQDAAGLPVHMLLTPWYNPLYAFSDLPAIGLLLIEVLTGRHPLRVEARAPHPLAPRAEQWLNGRVSLGLGRMARRLVAMPLPSELDPAVSPALEAIALRCLGLKRDGDALELEAAYADPGELARALAPA